MGEAIEITDADVSLVTSAADKVYLVRSADPYISHLELQSGPDPRLDARTLLYNGLLRWRHVLPVVSVVVLLHPRAQHPNNTGRVRESRHGGKLSFQYQLIRVWRKPVESLLKGGIGTLPLAPISAVKPAGLMEVIQRMRRRIEREVPPEDAGDLWTATRVLMGLRYPPPIVNDVLSGVHKMKESSTYQEILREGRVEGRIAGRVEGERTMLLRQGTHKFGPPDEKTLEVLDGIVDPERLEALSLRLLTVKSWQQLLKGK